MATTLPRRPLTGGQPATAAKPAAAVPAQVDDDEEAGEVDPAVWQQKLEELESQGGEFFYPKAGRNRLRLLPGNPVRADFFIQVDREYQGNTRSKYLVKAVVFDGETREVKAVVLSKTVLRGILNLLAEGYDLLGRNGHGITIVRTGTGMDTSYATMPSSKPQALPEDLEDIDMSLEELAGRLLELDSNRTARNGKKPGGSGQDEEADADESDF